MAPLTKAQLLKAAVAQAWRQGELSYKFHKNQLKIYNAIQIDKSPRFFVLCSRRFGKSLLLTALSFEECIKHANHRVLYLAPTAKSASEIVDEIVGKLLIDCPEDLRPKPNTQTKEFRFNNGSILRVRGVNNESADNLRGGEAHLIILDEAAQMDNLQYVISSVCSPMTATTKGRLFFATTPPITPDHDSVKVYERLARKKTVMSFTLLDCPHIPDDEKIRMLEEAGEEEEHAYNIIYHGAHPKTTAARREYFCEFVTDASQAVIPEFTKEKQNTLVKEVKPPAFFKAYTGIDPGSRDNTGFIFGHVDFMEQRFVVEDCALLGNPSTQQIASTIKEAENRLWPHISDVKRISDIDLRLIRDLASPPYYLKLVKAQKSDMLASVNYLRNLVQTNRLIIHPRCTDLIRQMTNAVWNKNATDMARTQGYDAHYDLISALRYVVRAINWNDNPFPEKFYTPGFPGGPIPQGFHTPKNLYGKRKWDIYTNTPIGKKFRDQDK